MTSLATADGCDMSIIAEAPTYTALPEGQPDTRSGLASTSFLGLLATQFLVALNDNMFRWLIIPIGKDLVGQDLALSAGGVCFLLPFVVLAAPAGYLADRFSKRNVMIGCKVAEIVVMGLGVLTILSGNIWLMMVVLFLMGAQSALFSPSKYGSIPEIVRPDRISAANGLVGMTTMVAIIVGMVAGGYLYDWTTVPEAGPGQHRIWISAAALIGVAVVGWLVSLMIGRLKPANPSRPVPRNPAGQTYRDLAALFASRPLLLAALGSSFFWAMGVLAQQNIDKLAQPELVGDSQQFVGHLLSSLTLGIGLGAFLAGIWSGGKIRVGIVAFGAAGIALMSIMLYTVPPGTGEAYTAPFYWAGAWLFLLGVSAGLYDIPLLAFLQDRSPAKSRGRILAAYNFIAFTGMMLTAGLFWVLGTPLALSARQIFLGAGLVTVGVTVAIVYLVPTEVLRVIFGPLVKLLYRIRLRGLDNVPKEGGAILISNHVSWIDGLLLMYFSPRKVRMFADPAYFDFWAVRRFARHERVIPIDPASRRSVLHSIRTAREALKAGDLLCVFAEGGLSRTGQVQAFHPGFLTILKGTGAPVVPVCLHGLWGSIFSFEGGKYFWKWPRRRRLPVTLMFGKPIHDPAGVQQVRLAVQELGGKAMDQRDDDKMVPPRRFLRTCRRNMRRAKVADSIGAELSGANLLARTLVLRRLLRRHVLAGDEQNVGILMPPTVAAVVANAALSLDRRVTVNLNYTASEATINQCIARAGVRHVVTSRKVMERFDFHLEAELVFLEDFRDKVTFADKLVAGLGTWLVPVGLLERRLGLTQIDPDDLLTLIFTSGSTGEPKGVMLTHQNIGSNVVGFNQVLHLSRDDVMVGILPFFHSFGFTVTLWSVLTLDAKGAYHPNPLEPRQVGKLCREHGGTFLPTAPTFLRSFLRRSEPEDFASLQAIITGAEKMPLDLAEAFEKKFGVRPNEGYGTTELSPVVSTNVPPSRVASKHQKMAKEGSVGRPIPGVAAKVVDLDTGRDLGAGKSGMLLIKGPNVMKGYLDQPDKTAEVLRDGWYTTGDVAMIDEDGFIHITGRQSRFSKIGGEMVPHIRVEEALVGTLGLDEEDVRVAVTSVPHPTKGERLVVLHKELERTPEEIRRALAEAGLPPLWIPATDSFQQVDEIPVLGTGKLDLRAVRELAEERFPPQ